MKHKDVIIATILFTISSLVGVNAALMAYTNTSLLQKISTISSEQARRKALTVQENCTNASKRSAIINSSNKYLARLADYEAICNSAFADSQMIFTNMPNSSEQAVKMADEMHINLKAFSSAGVSPIIIVEPETNWGLVDFKEFSTGFYDKWLQDYFTALKKKGITDKQMGMWVPFPEANLPYWNNQSATPNDFGSVVNGYLSILKKEYPLVNGGILLNSASYDSTDFEWENGDYTSLLPYVKSIRPGLVDSFGLQGFPWAPSADKSGPGIFDAREYLNSDLAIEAAQKLNVSKIWFNTGSFSSKYTQDSGKTVKISPQRRKEILTGIYNELLRAKEKGYAISVNIFAEDKSKVAEATNWTYIDEISDNQVIFADFIRKAHSANISISLYDVKK